MARRILFAADEPGKGVRFTSMRWARARAEPISPEGVNGTAFTISPDSQQIAAIGPDKKGYLYPVSGGDPRCHSGLQSGRAANHLECRRQVALHLPTRRTAGARFPA